MLEDVARLHAKFDGLLLGDVGRLLNAGVHIEGPGSVEHAALQRADSTGARIEKDLSGKRRRPIRRDGAAVRSDSRLLNVVRPVPRHLKPDNIAEVRTGERCNGGVVVRSRSPVQGASLRKNREWRPRLPGK